MLSALLVPVVWTVSAEGAVFMVSTISVVSTACIGTGPQLQLKHFGVWVFGATAGGGPLDLHCRGANPHQLF